MVDTTGPRVITPYPTHGSENVAVNTLITAQFNEAIDPISVTTNTFFIVEQNTFEPITGVVSYVPATRQAKFTISSNLKSNTKYRAIVLGQEDPWATTVVGIYDTAGNYMNGQFDWVFTTGGSTSSDVELAAIPSGTTGYENVTTPNPTGIISPTAYLEVLDTSPSHYETNINTIAAIVVSFNDDLGYIQHNVLGTLILGEGRLSTSTSILDTYIEIKNMPVLGGSPTTLDWSGSFNTANDKLTITTDASLVSNYEYIVKIKEGLEGSTTLPLASDYTFMFTTMYDPLYATSVQVRLALGNLIEDIPDDTINRIIYQNSLYAAQLYLPLTVANTGIKWYISKYVECKSALDLLNNKFLNLGGISSRKVLADLTIDRGNQGRDIIALASNLMEDLTICVQNMEGLIISGGQSPSPDYAVPHLRDSRGPIRDATWRRLPKMVPRGAPSTPGRKSSTGISNRSKNSTFLRRRSF